MKILSQAGAEQSKLPCMRTTMRHYFSLLLGFSLAVGWRLFATGAQRREAGAVVYYAGPG